MIVNLVKFLLVRKVLQNQILLPACDKCIYLSLEMFQTKKENLEVITLARFTIH